MSHKSRPISVQRWVCTITWQLIPQKTSRPDRSDQSNHVLECVHCLHWCYVLATFVCSSSGVSTVRLRLADIIHKAFCFHTLTTKWQSVDLLHWIAIIFLSPYSTLMGRRDCSPYSPRIHPPMWLPVLPTPRFSPCDATDFVNRIPQNPWMKLLREMGLGTVNNTLRFGGRRRTRYTEEICWHYLTAKQQHILMSI